MREGTSLECLEQMTPQLKMDFSASWAPHEDLPKDVYDIVTAANCTAVAYARWEGFALRVKRQDRYRVCIECV